MKIINKKYFTRFCAVLLTVVILAISLPLSVASEEPYIEEPLEETVDEVIELTDRREENVKHFDMGDGTYNAISYAKAVHRKDQNGEWQPINNRLSLTTIQSTNAYSTPDMRTVFADQFKPNADLVTLSENGYSVSMSILQKSPSGNISMDDNVQYVDSAPAAITNLPSDTQTWSIAEEATVNNASRIVYSNIKNGIDLEYILEGNDLKENIIVKSRQASYVYEFQLTLAGLRATLNDDGSISLADNVDESVKYIIPAPYMYDANGELSYQVEYELVEIKTGMYIFTVTANSEWINDSQRTLPVTIDPTIIRNPIEDQQIWDTYTTSYLNIPRGDYEDLHVGVSETAYYRFTLPNVNGCQVTQAQLKLTYSFPESCAGESINLELRRVGAAWDEETFTEQSSLVPLHGFAGNTLTINGSDFTETTINNFFDFTNLALMWYSGQYQNHGLAIRRTSGTIDSIYFKSSESESASHRPYIRITYVENFEDGVYMFKNVGASNMYMDVRSPSEQEGSYMQQYIYDSSETPGTDFTRSALFKVIKDEDSDLYIIRLMSNNALTFKITDNGVITKEIPLDDSLVSDSDMHSIIYRDNGYTIQKSFSARVVAAKNTVASGEGYGNLSLLTYATASNLSNLAKWELIKYEPEREMHGVSFKLSAPLKVGNNVTVTPIVYSTSPLLNKITMNTTYIDREKVTSVDNGYNGRFTITNIRDNGSYSVEVYLGKGENITYIGSIPIEFQLRFEEGSYLIKNSDLNAYTYALPYSGGHVSMQGLIESDYQRWEISHDIDGYYKIKLYNSNLYLTAPSPSEEYVTLETLSSDTISRQLWMLNENGNTFIPKYYYESDYQPYVDATETMMYIRCDEDYSNDSDCYYRWEFYKIGFMADIDPVIQQGENWCWIACANMFAQHCINTDNTLSVANINLSQSYVKTQLLGNSNDDGGNPIRIQKAIELYLDLAWDDDVFYSMRYNDKVFRKNELKAALDNGSVVICSMVGCEKYRPFMPIVEEEIGHYMVIYGYIEVEEETFFIVADPWPDFLGQPLLLPFEDIIISKHYTSGNYKRWEDTIVIDKGDIYTLAPKQTVIDEVYP